MGRRVTAITRKRSITPRPIAFERAIFSRKDKGFIWFPQEWTEKEGQEQWGGRPLQMERLAPTLCVGGRPLQMERLAPTLRVGGQMQEAPVPYRSDSSH